VKSRPPEWRSAIPSTERYWQLWSLVSVSASVSASDLVSADDLLLPQVKGRNIDCQWRTWEGGESLAELRKWNMQMKISMAQSRMRSSRVHNYTSSPWRQPADYGGGQPTFDGSLINHDFLHPPCYTWWWIRHEVGGVDISSANFIHLMMRNDYCYMTWTTTFLLIWMYDLEALMNRFRLNSKCGIQVIPLMFCKVWLAISRHSHSFSTISCSLYPPLCTSHSPSMLLLPTDALHASLCFYPLCASQGERSGIVE
jgi:hypothetical protein